MNILEWITLIFLILSLITYVGDSFALFFRDLKTALADGELTQSELTKLEADARLVVKGVLKLVGLFRTL